jgi:Ca2+-transporting ATPase
LDHLRDTTRKAMRTLAFGYALLPDGTPADSDSLHTRRESIEDGLVYAGFVAIRDPLRDDVKDAVAQCREAGIEVKMITGDNVETARAIGSEIGLLDRSDALVLTSQEFNALSDAELKERIPRLRILARARPLDKFRMVKLLQERGEVVAVTGDGTNDAPALKKADVGLAMGRAGTEVAKEASKIVLLDDAFSTIVKAIHWGRSLYENIQRFIQFQLTINVSALVIAFLGPLFGVKPPFTILQLLWINVIMDTFASIALCSEPPRPGLMRLPPKRRDENILTRPMLWNIFTTAAFFVVVMMALLLLMKGSPDHPGWFVGTGEWSKEFPQFTIRQVSIFFTVYILFQVWNEINCRSLVPEVSGFQGLFRNLVFLSIVGAIVAGQVLIVSFGGVIFQVEPLGLLDWLAIAAFTASVLVFAEAARRLRLIYRM